VRFQPTLPTNVIGDGGRLRQVTTNLVSNAIKFTHQGHILLSVSGTEEGANTKIKIEVIDTGVGIAEDKRVKIFDTFQQADTSTTRQFGGTGLGLSISKRLIEAMNGTIGVRSKLGHGSNFWVELTLPTSDEEDIEWETTFEIDGERALIVDDNAVNRQILDEQLSAWGFQPTLVEGAQEALQALRDAAAKEEPFDVAILDYMMPEMDGEALARGIKDDPNIEDVPLLILTSVDRAGDARRFKEIGACGYLVKPVRSALLYETLVGVLSSNVRVEEEILVQEPEREQAELAFEDKIKILLAEDNEVNQLVINHMLDSKVFHLVVANNGREALAAVRDAETPFDLILMDVSMPEMDGYEATRKIRALEEKSGAHTPIVCLTAHVMKDDVDRSQAAGMDDYLSKPVSKERLEKAINRWTSDIIDNQQLAS